MTASTRAASWRWQSRTSPAGRLEFLVDDLESTGARVLAAGATRFEHQPNADHCFVYADPAGHPFCLSTWGVPRVGD